MKKYLIMVLTLEGIILKYKVEEYEITSNIINFKDPKTGMAKFFPMERTTIEEVKE